MRPLEGAKRPASIRKVVVLTRAIAAQEADDLAVGDLNIQVADCASTPEEFCQRFRTDQPFASLAHSDGPAAYKESASRPVKPLFVWGAGCPDLCGAKSSVPPTERARPSRFAVWSSVRVDHRSSRVLGLGLALLAGVACSADPEPLEEVGTLSAPATLDFGTVQIGAVRTATLALTNTGEVPLRVLRVEATSALVTDSFRFEIPLEGFVVPPLSSVAVEVAFAPRVTTRDPAGYAVTVIFGTNLYDPKPPFAPRNVQVVLRGRPVPPGLEVSPNPVDFGRVFVDSDKTVEFTVTNVADVPIDVFGDVLEGGGPRWLPDDLGTFSVQPAPEADGRLAGPLEPGASVAFRATFRPGAVGTNLARAGWYLTNCDDPECRVLVQFEGLGSTDLLLCEPAAVDFGRVNPGRRATREIACTNPLSDPVTLASTALEDSRIFDVAVAGGVPQVVGPGATLNITVAYEPFRDALGRTDQGTLSLMTRDPNGNDGSVVRIALNGQAGGPRIIVEPNPLEFGLVAIGVPLSRGLVVRNDGPEPLFINELRLGGRDFEAFSVESTGFTLATGEARLVPVTFDPQREGVLAATLTLFSNDDQQPELVVSLGGEADRVIPCRYELAPSSIDFGTVFVGTQPIRAIEFRNTGSDDCIVNGIEIQSDAADSPFSLLEAPAQGIRVAPGDLFSLRVRYRPSEPGIDRALVLAQVSDPAGPVAGIPLLGEAEPPLDIGCPPPQVTPAGTPLILTAGTADATRYRWRLVSAPNGGNNTPDLWDPDPPNARSVRFLPFIVGVYEIELTVDTSGGQQVSCRTQVTAEGQGLRVTLTWDGPGDVDLHVHNGDPGTAWFQEPVDCHYSNRTPPWASGPLAVGPNPELDFDNTTADGPENTSIDRPQLSRTYHIGVHHYARAAGRRATIEVFCGGTSVPDASFVSRPLRGNNAGRCTSDNDFWRVATVRFTSGGQCVIRPIDTYASTNQACSQL